MIRFSKWCFIGFMVCFAAKNVSGQLVSGKSFGKGVNFVSADTSFTMKFNARFQTLMTATDFMNYGGLSEMNTSLMVRRARLKFGGQAFTKNVKYKMELGLSNRDFSSPRPEMGNTANMVLDAFLKYKVHKSLTVWFGQTKLPGNRERVISSQKLQFVDRSLLNKYFTLDRDIGVQLRHQFSLSGDADSKEAFLVRDIVSISQGEGRNVTAKNIGGYDYTARVELLPFGEFTSNGDYVGSAVDYEEKAKLSLASTYDFNHNTGRSAGNLGSFIVDSLGDYAGANISTFFVDAMFKFKSFSYMGAYSKKTSTVSDAEFEGKFFSGESYNNQVGFMLSRKSELAFRHTHVSGNSTGIIDMYTLGFSRYASKHNLKFQTDFSMTQSGANSDMVPMIRFQTEMAF